MIGLANVYKVSKAWSVVVHKLNPKKRQKSKKNCQKIICRTYRLRFHSCASWSTTGVGASFKL